MKHAPWARVFAAACTLTLAIATVACGGTGTGSSAQSVTVYSADGLGQWYKGRFAAFTRDTGLAVNLVEAGSAEVVSRVAKEQTNPQADLVITLPPFIQKAAESGLLVASGADLSAVTEGNKDKNGKYVAIVDNYLTFIANPAANIDGATWDGLLNPRFKGKLQYSTPGQAGDGTAMLVLLHHVMGEQGALEYLVKLQANNVGPSSSTGKLQPKVSNGELLIANGDVQMNLASIRDDGSKFSLFFPAKADGTRTTVSLPYTAGVAKGAPHLDNAKKLLAYLISEPVQRTIDTDALGMPVRAGLTPVKGPNTPADVLAGVQIWHPDWDDVLAGLDNSIAAYQKATGS